MIHNSAFGTKFRFEFDDIALNDINDNIITCNMPGFTLGYIDKKYNGKSAYIPGTSIMISDLNITVKADDDYSLWIQIFKWIVDNFNGNEIYKSGSLYLLNSKDTPIFSISLYNIFPTDITEIQYSRTETEPEILTFNATFKINNADYNTSF